jgi:iron complex outermembrane receptor protein
VFSGPGFVQVYMRGVASGGDGNHSGSQPSVGMYLDEQPITTIQGALDIHMYDIDRVEALAGPQGTLYGASSQSGTVRIITRKPIRPAFSAGLFGGSQRHRWRRHRPRAGRLRQPADQATRAAVRLVGWQKHDAGYVDNIRGTRTYPDLRDHRRQRRSWPRTTTTPPTPSACAAALRFDINENWTITPHAHRAEAEGLRQRRHRPQHRQPGRATTRPAARWRSSTSTPNPPTTAGTRRR